MNKIIELFNRYLSLIIKKKIQKYEFKYKKTRLKISLNLFYADKIFEEANKPITYFTKVKIKSNSKKFDRLMNKSDKNRMKKKALYSKLEFYEKNK